MEIKRGEIVLVNLDPVFGSEQGDIRPVLVIQNDFGNKYSPTTIVAPFTTKKFSKEFPTNIFLTKNECGLASDSTLLLNQIRVIDKRRIRKKLSSLDNYTMQNIDLAIKISLGINN
jgi:mRNA interferase MazF